MEGSQVTVNQLQMPGIADLTYAGAGPSEFEPGQRVLYLGRVSGGPRYGSKGIVREVRGRKAVVEIEGRRRRRRTDVWHIPYYFLAVAGRAA